MFAITKLNYHNMNELIMQSLVLVGEWRVDVYLGVNLIILMEGSDVNNNLNLVSKFIHKNTIWRA